MAGGRETVSAFIKSAFPDGTIPFAPLSKGPGAPAPPVGDAASRANQAENFWQDYSFNRLGYEFAPQEETERPDQRSPNYRHSPRCPSEWLKNGAIDWENEPFPIWPPDLFGATSLLIERSAIYQKLRPVSADFRYSSSIDYEPVIAPWRHAGHFADADPFRVQDAHQTMLRLAGALWASGALTISGFVGRAKDTEPDRILNHEEILNLNCQAANNAIEFVKTRYSNDIGADVLKAFVDAISVRMTDELIIWPSQAPQPTGPLDGLLQGAPAINLWAPDLALRGLCAMRTNKTSSSHEFRTLPLSSGWQDRMLIVWAHLFISHEWRTLLASEDVVSAGANSRRQEHPPAWHSAALRLHILADEAGKGMGFSGKGFDSERGHSGDAHRGAETDGLRAGLSCKSMWDAFSRNRVRLAEDRWAPRTMARGFNDDLGSVLPKARTPSAGCTIRSLSHNMCLLPPRSRVRARWRRQPRPVSSPTFNVLLIPYPYQIKSKHVSASQSGPPDNEISPANKVDWGHFAIKPYWLYEDAEHPNGRSDFPPESEKEAYHKLFWDFVDSLLKDQTDGTINAIIFPEASLDWATFEYVTNRIAESQSYKSISLVVAGVTEAPGKTLPHLKTGEALVEGNFVATFMGDSNAAHLWTDKYVRPKHHRWRLDKSQLKSYALSHRLDPGLVWWEDIDIPAREMLFAEFSKGSVHTSLICEDLARIEPCQVALRAVGPNLIFVLLMDAAQVVQRWPYQYAGVLSDDPGSSVLTLTSFGLIRRSSYSEGHESRSIALWREPLSGRPEMITLPKGYDAQLVSLRREFTPERTLDGRSDNGDSAIVWRLAGLTPVRALKRPPGGGPDDDHFPKRERAATAASPPSAAAATAVNRVRKPPKPPS